MADSRFDRVFPAQQRFRSWLHWTPVDVAIRSAALLDARGAARILDVGAGVGKVCLVGALTTRATWVGIEQDAEMVAAARTAATKLHVEHRAIFVEGDATRCDWSEFDAVYLFNPFGERLLEGSGDPLSRREAYISCIERTQHRLAAAAPGTHVVTYHGFGGDLPPCYELVHREPALEDELALWVRRVEKR